VHDRTEEEKTNRRAERREEKAIQRKGRVAQERRFFIFFLFPADHYHSDAISTLPAVVVVRIIQIKNKFN
jgi:hypothetical protein